MKKDYHAEFKKIALGLTASRIGTKALNLRDQWRSIALFAPRSPARLVPIPVRSTSPSTSDLSRRTTQAIRS